MAFTIASARGLRENLEVLRVRLLQHRHSALLLALVVAFAIRPLVGDQGFAPLAFSFALIMLMLVSLYTVQIDELLGDREKLIAQRKRGNKIGWLLAVPAIAERFLIVITPSRYVMISGMAFWFLFFSYITWNELRAVLKQKEVTGETISLSISIYLLLGMTWTVLYVVLYYANPHAFAFGTAPELSASKIFPVMLYFSLTTISTVGFGDITPVSLQARYAAVAEAITGQFYLAILVARLVGLYMSRSASRDADGG